MKEQRVTIEDFKDKVRSDGRLTIDGTISCRSLRQAGALIKLPVLKTEMLEGGVRRTTIVDPSDVEIV